jgi:hypothetical protein
MSVSPALGNDLFIAANYPRLAKRLGASRHPMNIRSGPLGAATRALSGVGARLQARRRRRLELAALPRIGGLSSIPSRAKDLAGVLERIVPQVERLHLFLHGYESIPPEARHSRILPVLAPKAHPYRASGKLFGLGIERLPCLYFCFDDDILYPPDYVARLARALIRHEGDAIVGFHASRFLPPHQSYIRDRRIYPFPKRLLFDTPVDELGAGTIAFASGRLPIDPVSWKYGDVDDLMLAIEAERRGLKRIALARHRKYIRRVPGKQVESLWRTVQADESRSVEQMRVLLRLMSRLPEETTATALEPKPAEG